MGFSADMNVPLPDMTQYDKTPAKRKNVIRASVVHKLNLKFAQRVAQKMKEVQ